MEMTVDLKLAANAAASFSVAAGLGCVLAGADGDVLSEAGYTCKACTLCRRLAQDGCRCPETHAKALQEALRFGGKYIYYCTRGLAFAVSPIMGRGGCEAKLLAGPFLMADAEEYLALELADLLKRSPEIEEELRHLLAEIPLLATGRVSAVSNMLFLAASFVSSAQEVTQMRLQEASDLLQGQISPYILQLKQENALVPYPYEKEQALLEAMAQNRRRDANRLLNELLGVILIISGMSFSRMKSHINELLVLMSRKAVENGADTEVIQRYTHQYYQHLSIIQGFEELCFWLTEVVNQMMTYVFDFSNTKHAGSMRKASAYIRANLLNKLTLEDVAAEACLSPAYFSRVFRKESGITLQQFIVNERMKRAVSLMRRRELTLLEVAELVGIRSQSLFNRLFVKVHGTSPSEFRKRLLSNSMAN